MSKSEKITVKVNEDLHPKTRRYPFVDKNGDKHESVASAFVKVTEGFVSKLTVGQIIEILAKIIFTQIVTHKDKLGGLIRSTMGMTFVLGQKNVDFLPGEPSQGWSMLYGVALSKARQMFLDVAKFASLTESTGAVPPGCQPCLRCGGSGTTAGHGHFLAVFDGKGREGWKHVGACFDCLPKGQTERGLGYITRSKARHNWTYAHDAANTTRWNDNHVGIEENLWNPDDSNLWKIVLDPADVNMKEVILDVDDSEVPL